MSAKQNDMVVAAKVELDGCSLLLNKLEPVRKALQASIDKDKVKLAVKAQKISKILEDYPTAQDLQDAYGYRYITEDEYMAGLDALEQCKGVVEQATKYTVALGYLEDTTRVLRRQIRNMEWELTSEADKERITRESAERRARHEARKAGMTINLEFEAAVRDMEGTP